MAGNCLYFNVWACTVHGFSNNSFIPSRSSNYNSFCNVHKVNLTSKQQANTTNRQETGPTRASKLTHEYTDTCIYWATANKQPW